MPKIDSYKGCKSEENVCTFKENIQVAVQVPRKVRIIPRSEVFIQLMYTSHAEAGQKTPK